MGAASCFETPRRARLLSMRPGESSETRWYCTSIRLDLRFLEDNAELRRGLLHPGVELGRGARNGLDAAGGEALLDVGHVQDLHHFGVELVDDLLRRALGRDQQRPVRQVD